MQTRGLQALATICVLPLAGCVMIETGPPQHEHQTIPRDKSELARVEFKMGAGELKVQGGAKELMEADFDYNVVSWKPVVRYSSSGLRGILTIEQPTSRSHMGGNVKYTWDVQLNDDVPIDMTANFGAGEARLDLGSLSLRSLEINMGVGELRLDLRGDPKRDYSVRIRGGVGEATVRLPSDVGVVAEAAGGIGGIQTRGLHKNNGRWVNDAYGRAKTTIHLDVRGGIGAINLISD